MLHDDKVPTGCINCGSCNVCPTSVDIPSCLTLYDKSVMSVNKSMYQIEYESLIKFTRAHNCIGCGRCLKKCPVEIDIIDRLEDVAEYFIVD